MENQETLLVIHVLAQEYYNDCHITGSINVPLDMLKEYAHGLDRKTPIVVYCASYTCPASASAWHTLHEMGFTHLWAYEGGMAEWCQLGYSVKGACSKEYLKTQHQKPEESNVQEISANELKKLLSESAKR